MNDAKILIKIKTTAYEFIKKLKSIFRTTKQQLCTSAAHRQACCSYLTISLDKINL